MQSTPDLYLNCTFLLTACVFVCSVGQYLVQRILTDGAALGLTLAFVWNRNSDKLKGLVPDELILADLTCFAERCKLILQKAFLSFLLFTFNI